MKERDELHLREVLAERRRDHFDAGFTDRTLARWHTARSARTTLEILVIRQFWRLAPFAAAATIVLAVHNVRRQPDAPRQSFVRSLLGIRSAPQQTESFSIDALYGLGSLAPSIKE